MQLDPLSDEAKPAVLDTAVRTLLAQVQLQPWAHDFFALLRRIDALRPLAPRTGEALRPTQEALRLAQRPELDFAPAALAALEWRDALAPRLLVRFLGLLGPQGPLPLHLTEFVRDRARQHGDSAPAHFLDLFHHRLLELFYRAWAQAQPAVQRDRPHDDRYRAWLGAVAGLPSAPAALSADALAFQAGLLAERSRYPEALLKVLRQYFQVPIVLEPHVGHWLVVDSAERSRLGYAGNRAERSTTPPSNLGASANAGSRAWDRQYRFRLHLGPLTLAQYRTFLPGGSAWQPLLQWVRLLAGAGLGWELQLVLTAPERPAPRLDRSVQLGVTSWLWRTARARPDTVQRHLRIRLGTSFLQRCSPSPA
jgi:type VI secretion system protein ImpH